MKKLCCLLCVLCLTPVLAFSQAASANDSDFQILSEDAESTTDEEAAPETKYGANVQTAALNDTVKAFMVETGLSLGQLMRLSAASTAYARMMGGASTLTIAAQIAGGAYEAPLSAVIYQIGADSLNAYLSKFGFDTQTEDPALCERLYSAVPGALVSMLCAGGGTDMLSAASALRAGETYQAPEDMPRRAVMILSFDGDFDIACSFVTNESGITSAAALFIQGPYDNGLEKQFSALSLDFPLERYSLSADEITWLTH